MSQAEVTLVVDSLSEETLNVHVPGARVAVIPNPVSIQSATPPPDRQTTVLFAGHVTVSKGVSDLLHAWASDPCPGWTLKIAGRSSGEYPLQVIRDLELDGDRVSLLGELETEDLTQQMSECGIFVLPSHTEGFPNAIAEAMMLGCPIVGTDVGAIPEMLADGAGLVSPRESPQTLAKHLALLSRDDALRSQLGRAAHARANREYSIDTIFARYCEIWQSCD